MLAKISAVLPPPLATTLERSALLVPVLREESAFGPHVTMLRQAVRKRTILRIGYVDASGSATERLVWPLALLFFANATLLGAWCDLRRTYRFFRTDRIIDPRPTGDHFDARNGALLDQLLTDDCDKTSKGNGSFNQPIADKPTVA